MKTTVKSPTQAIYSHPDTQMSLTKEQQASQARHTSALSGQNGAAAAFAGAALLVLSFSALQALSVIATVGALAGMALAAYYYFAIKPILAMDFDISPANEEMATIIAELWD